MNNRLNPGILCFEILSDPLEIFISSLDIYWIYNIYISNLIRIPFSDRQKFSNLIKSNFRGRIFTLSISILVLGLIYDLSESE